MKIYINLQFEPKINKFSFHSDDISWSVATLKSWVTSLSLYPHLLGELEAAEAAWLILPPPLPQTKLKIKWRFSWKFRANRTLPSSSVPAVLSCINDFALPCLVLSLATRFFACESPYGTFLWSTGLISLKIFKIPFRFMFYISRSLINTVEESRITLMSGTLI